MSMRRCRELCHAEGVVDGWVAREDVVDFAHAKEVPDAVVQTGEQQTPVVPFERYVGSYDHTKTAGIDIPDPAHVHNERGRLGFAHIITKLEGRLGIQDA